MAVFFIFKIMENEIWKDVIGYEGKYQISNMGRVRSLKFGKVKMRKGGVNSRGYLNLVLYKEGNQKTFSIHSLVARAFIDKDYTEKALVVNHKDFNKKNNILSNLEVVTYRENGNKKHLTSSSKYVGVHWSIKDKSWISRIVVNKSRKYLGYFNTEIEASQYYEAALVCINEGRFEDIVTKVRKPKGCSFHKLSNKWMAQVYKNGKSKYLGLFKTEQEAQNSYLEYKSGNF